jgi:vitamin B12 transporter
MSTTSMIWAQSGGSLEGQVVDKNGKFPLPTVSIIIVGAKKHGSTDPDGRYFIENIPPGTYKVTFELPGYLKESVKNITITAGEGTELNAVLKMGFAHEMTVTARREIVSLQRVPQNVEVLTATELEETPVINVVQALNNITGVDVATGSGNTGPGTFISINGYEDVYIRKMVDGVDVGEVITNWSMLNAYPEELVSQIEVIKGGSSSIWGSNMGGIINLVTKRPRDLERPIISIKGIFSSFGEMDFENASTIPNSGSIKNYSANITGTQKDFYYMLGFNKDNHDGFIGLSSENNFSIFTKVGYNFNETTYLDFLYNYNRMKNKGLCFLETDMFKAWGIDYYWHYKDDSESTSQVGSLKFSTLVTPSMNIEAQLKFNKMDMDMTRENLEGTFDPPGSVSSFSLNDQKIGFTVKNSYNPSENFSLISGIDYYRIKADFSDYIADQPIIYVNEWAPFLNAEYRIGNFGLHAGARYDYNSSFGNQLSPSVGAVFNFLKASLIRVNVARTFRVPPLWYTLGESYMDAILPNPDLEPERAWAYSAGIESQELEFIWVKFSGYYHLMTDGIVRVSHPDQVGRFTWGNSDEFIRQGYEAELGVITPIGIIAYIGTNYNDHTNKGTGEIMSWIPTRTYKTGLKYINEKLDLAVNIRGRYIWWNEDEYLMSLFEPRDKVLMLDIRISKGFKISQFIQARLFLDVFNLTDQLYWDRKDCPNPRRWAQIGFEIKYK